MILKVFLSILGIVIIAISFFFDEEEGFSPAQESKENVYKSTHFTKLTNLIRNVYVVLIGIFILLTFML